MFALWRKDVYLSHLTFRLVPRLFNWNVSVFINCQHCTQAVKNSPAMLETLVRSLGWEDALEKEMATLSSILAWRISWTEEPSKLHGLQPQVHGVTKSRMWLSDSHTDTQTHTHTHTHTHTLFSSKWQVVVPLAKAGNVGQRSDRKCVSSPKVDSTLLLL